ncbi:hypothetical protein LCGC14_0841580 [marine sediment metagenome]|uniref:Right handed beta helix domain-containing protein n=1 Tax=marine sediment metagenome TaxID=412755 RepID=A0A0F9SK94_9ZZZZ|nr:hypothetical protein [Candidatus Aminicenantes bacterium]HEB36511.1 hypothetical protein [Candidatus Aminicenantes bacterium]
MKKDFIKTFFVGISVALLLIFVPTASATVLNVSSGDSIQAMIDSANSGDTILVAAGTYREYLHITIDNLTIIGAGIDKSIIDLDGLTPYWHYPGNSSFASRAGVLISGYGSPGEIVEGVTFKGFTVKNAGLNPPIMATGTHTGSDDDAVLTDSTKTWTPGALVGKWVHNYGDKRLSTWKPARSYGQITANTATTVTASLSGGWEDDWDSGDEYLITPYEEFHNTYWIDNPNYDALRGISVSNGKNILIQYCKVVNSGYGGISVGKARLTSLKQSEGVTIDNCIANDNPVVGISVGDHKGLVTITNNVANNNGQPHYSDLTREYMGVGILLAGSSYDLTTSAIISDNECTDNGFIGIELKGSDKKGLGYIDGVTIENNKVTGHNLDQDGAGIFLYSSHYYGHPDKCKNVTVKNSNVSKNIRGIVAYNVQEIIIEGNKITTDSGDFPKGQGAIKLDGAHEVEVLNNNIHAEDGTGMRIKNAWDGAQSNDNTITGNTIKGALFAGILIDSGAYDNTFTYNTIKDTKVATFWAGRPWEETQADGVFLDSDAGTGNEFHKNNINNNDDDGMESQTSVTVDATCNWWGSVSGPSGIGGDGVRGNVNFTPWLLSSAPDGSCYPFTEILDIIENCANAKNHGQFVSCVTRKINKLLREEEITKEDADAIISWAKDEYIH